MNAVLWTLVAVLAPALLGFIIYLLVRGEHSDLECSQCGAPVKETYVVCPNCGAKLRPACPNCSSPVERNWKVCPVCAQPLPENFDSVAPPIQRKDNGLQKILILLIALPILLICLLIILNFSYSSGGGAATMREVFLDEYYEEQESDKIRENVRNWLDGLEVSPHRAYALRYDYSADDSHEYFFLIFIPGAGNAAKTSFGQSSSWLGTTFSVNLESTGNDGSVFCVRSSAQHPPKLKITLDGWPISCEVTTVDYNPTLFYIIPKYNELTATASDVFLPERLSVVKLVYNKNSGVAVVTDNDTILKILSTVDAAPYLELDHPIYEDFDFKSGFEIIIEYKVHEGKVLHEDMITCLAFEQNGAYYFSDDRPNNGRHIRQIDEDFYNLLSDLF